jgi:hypothetical protein
VLSLDGMEVDSFQKMIEAVQAHAPSDKVQIHILRDGAELTVTATLGAITIREWIPRFLASGEGKSIAWLAHDHAITVLPAVSSLKVLRAAKRVLPCAPSGENGSRTKSQNTNGRSTLTM